MAEQAELKLGDRVTITGTVRKGRGLDGRWDRVRYRDAGVPGFVGYGKDERGGWSNTFTPHAEGVVIGKRRYRSMENDEGIWIPDGVQDFVAYIVAWHMSRSSVVVRLDQMIRGEQ